MRAVLCRPVMAVGLSSPFSGVTPYVKQTVRSSSMIATVFLVIRMPNMGSPKSSTLARLALTLSQNSSWIALAMIRINGQHCCRAGLGSLRGLVWGRLTMIHTLHVAEFGFLPPPTIATYLSSSTAAIPIPRPFPGSSLIVLMQSFARKLRSPCAWPHAKRVHSSLNAMQCTGLSGASWMGRRVSIGKWTS